MTRSKEIKTLEIIYAYHSECVDFTFYNIGNLIKISDGDYDILIDLEDLKTLNKIADELGWNE